MGQGNRDLVIAALARVTAPICDDCLATKANVTPRQTVFHICTALFMANRIARERGVCGTCGNAKNTSVARAGRVGAAPAPVPAGPVRTGDFQGSAVGTGRLRGEPSDDKAWHWEGHVQATLARSLTVQGWQVTAMANTASKEPGIDVIATKNGRWLAVEVKGYPSKTYEYGPKRGEAKRTTPSSQARQWFSHALLSMMQLRHKRPDAEIAACFPDYPTYRRLLERTRSSFELLGFGVYFVAQDGRVLMEMPHAAP